MSAKVLTMDGTTSAQAGERAVRHIRRSYYAEDRTFPFLFQTTNQHGKRDYFVRVLVTGLRGRLFGPFRSKGAAIAAYDALLRRVLEAMNDAANEDMDEAHGNNGREMIELPGQLKAVQ